MDKLGHLDRWLDRSEKKCFTIRDHVRWPLLLFATDLEFDLSFSSIYNTLENLILLNHSKRSVSNCKKSFHSDSLGLKVMRTEKRDQRTSSKTT